ncbi:MAG: hypothetical protein O7F08_07275 [Deltaproteobacteria bacterium]|nr:hypothetical protein [Deltaproteobacteria bacterium]
MGTWRVGALTVLLGLCLLGGTAYAEDRAAAIEAPTVPKLVVRPFKGAQASKIRGAAVKGLRGKPVELVPSSDQGHVLPARAMGVDALFEGDVLHEDGVWSVYVRLVDGKSADVISQHFYEGDTSTELARAVQTEMWDDFQKDIEKLEPEVAVAPGPVGTATTTKDRLAAVDIELDFKFVHRSLTWNDDLMANLRDYTLAFGPGVQTKFQYFPGAHFTSGVGAQFGIDFEWERLFNFDSTRDDGFKFPTEAQQFLVGLRWRYPAGRWEPTIIADYGVHKFQFGVTGPPVTTAGIPSVKYKFYRLGAGFRVGIGKKENFIVAFNAAFRGLLSAGGIESTQWFPQAKGNGMDALIVLGYALPKGFEIRLGVDYRGYWFDLNPVPPAPLAGGALDQYWGISIGAAWRY